MAGKALPYDAEIAYLGSAANCYIDTLIVPDDHIGVYVGLERTDSADRWICGCRNDSGNTRFGIGKTANSYFGWGAYNSGYTFNSGTISLNWLRNHRFYSNTNNKAIANPLPFTPVYSIHLFNWINAGAVATADVGVRISSFKISRDSDVILDFIPVRVGTVGYMYDRVSGQLFGNLGTGDFVVGPDIQ